MAAKTSLIATHVVRVILGLVFFVFGLLPFFVQQPPPEDPEVAKFAGALFGSYLFLFLKVTEIVAGALLLANRFVPLALTVLAPIVLNIVAFHTFLAPPNPVTFIVLGSEIWLAWAYRDSFRGVLAAKARPYAG